MPNSERGLDPDLAEALARLPRGGQRWLKTALVALGDLDDSRRAAPRALPEYLPEPELEPEPEPEPKRKPRRLKRAPVDLEEVIAGRASLDEQLEAYPELADELEGLSDVIDLLREAGKTRRRKGQDVLKELGLVPPEDEPAQDPDEQDAS
jgi:hypothetical protein